MSAGMFMKGAGFAVFVAFALVACSSDDTTGTSSSSSSSSGTSTSGTSSSGGSKGTTSSSGSIDTASVSPPTLMSVEKMMGALHVKWTNPEIACEKIEIERLAEMPDGSMMEDYKVIKTVGGDVDNSMDPTATEDMTYSYRLRCKTGSTYSSYSDVKKANPKG